MRFLLVLASIVLSGCSTDLGPSRAEVEAHWEAQNVFPKNFKQDLLAFLRTYLNDPAHIRSAGVTSRAAKPSVPANAMSPACATTPAKVTASMRVRMRALRFMSRASSTASSTESRRSPFARTSPTHLFRNSSV